MPRVKILTLTLISIFLLHVGTCDTEEILKKCELEHKTGSKKFPNEFQFGVSTAAYQIEGGWNEDGRGPSIWDTFTHQHPEMIDDQSTGDVAADSYHKFDQDLEALKELKVSLYRLSISWSRILPTGDISSKNQKGIDYYNMVIDKLLANGIKPMVTMLHYDLPETLSRLGGLTNLLFIKYFKNYAKLLFETFGDRVKIWVTFNEPFEFCIPGYGAGNYPPMGHASGTADYLCMDTTVKAHAEVYHLYKTHYFEQQKGKIGITLNSRFFFSMTNNASLVDRAMQFSMGFLGNPLFGKTGNYPEVMLDIIGNHSLQEGRTWSRLMSLTDTEINFIKNASDFLGLNYYTSRYVVEAIPPEGDIPSFDYDSGVKYEVDPTWVMGRSSWLHCVPEGLEGILNWIKTNYNNIEVIVTENGWSDDEGHLDDTERIDYLKTHLQAILNAINNGCNVTGYTHWSLIDNFEWQRGFSERFGLYYVNMSSSSKERIAKNSARYYRSVIETKTIPESLVNSSGVIPKSLGCIMLTCLAVVRNLLPNIQHVIRKRKIIL